MLKVSVFLLAIALAQAAIISPTLKHALKTKDTIDIMVAMREKTIPVLNKLKLQSFPTRAVRLNAVAGSLKTLAADSQKSVLAYLNTKDNIKVKSLWINNKISIKGANAELIQSLAGMAEVDSIKEDRIIPWNRPAAPIRVPTPKELQWGVGMIEAPAAWEQGYNGNGVVVATIDTGARYTHKNLYRNWRQNYGWFDPYDGTSLPVDDDGHGTHTIGTIAGSDGVGVAPGAEWIACIGCNAFGCTDSALDQCGQFMSCPTLPDGTEEDCSQAPHLVSNSWGGGGGDDFYVEVVAAWEAGGIIPIFANGNAGSDCNTAGSPGDYPNVIGIGATDEAEELAYFSSNGPSYYDVIKPDFAAPGVDIISASYEDDDSYQSMSGTSMACPHAAGAVALLLTNGTELVFTEVNELLIAGAQQTIGESGGDCGGIPESEYPNNHVGWGRISIAASIGKLREKYPHH